MRFAALLFFAAALPALADSRFQIRRMTRDDVPVGKGQCDIRLQVDNEVEVSVHGDLVNIRTLSGQNARDDGSECNTPLPTRDIQSFTFEVKDSRNEINLVSEPSPRNGFIAIVHIRDTSGGFGRYHFRLTWALTSGDPSRGQEDFERAIAGSHFSWNNTVSFKGTGKGDASINNEGAMRLGQVNIEIDQSGKLIATFRVDRGRPIAFTGSVVAHEQNRWKADIISDDQHLRGPMYFSVNERGEISNVTVEATDGRDHLHLNWDRR